MPNIKMVAFTGVILFNPCEIICWLKRGRSVYDALVTVPVGIEFVEWRWRITASVRVFYRLWTCRYRYRLLILNHRTLKRFPHIDVL